MGGIAGVYGATKEGTVISNRRTEKRIAVRTCKASSFRGWDGTVGRGHDGGVVVIVGGGGGL